MRSLPKTRRKRTKTGPARDTTRRSPRVRLEQSPVRRKKPMAMMTESRSSKGLFVKVGFLRSLGWGRSRLFDARNQIGTRRRRVLPFLQGEFHRAWDGKADDALVFVNPIVFVERLGINSALVLQKLVSFLDALGPHRRGLRVVPHCQHQYCDDKEGAEDADRVGRQAGSVEIRFHLAPP